MACFVPSLQLDDGLTAPGYLVACVAYAAMLGARHRRRPAGPRAVAGPRRHLDAGRAASAGRGPSGACRSPTSPSGRWPAPSPRSCASGGAVLLLAVTVLAGQAACRRRPPGLAPRRRARRASPSRSSRAARSPRTATTSARAEVALVQGGGEQGTRKSDTGVVDVFERHVDATAGVRAAGRPRRVARGRHRHARVLRRRPVGATSSATSPVTCDAPMVVGTVEGAGPEHFTNAAVLVDADGDRRRPLRQGPPRALRRVRAVPLAARAVAGDALPDRDARDRRRCPASSTSPARSAGWRCRSPGRSSSPTAPAKASRPAPASCSTPPTARRSPARSCRPSRWRPRGCGPSRPAAGCSRSRPTGFSAIVDDHGRGPRALRGERASGSSSARCGSARASRSTPVWATPRPSRLGGRS